MRAARFFRLDPVFAPHRSGCVTFMNPYSWLVNRTRGDADLETFTIYADGILLVWLSNLARGAGIRRAAFDFSSVAAPVFADAEASGRTVFLIGGLPGVADAAALVIRRRHPKLAIAGTRSGYFDGEPAKDAALAEAGRAGIVIAGMGAPAQEAFIAELWRRGFRGAAYTCGGFLEQIAGTDGDYFPRWSDRWHLRWLYRLYREPGRLWRRYLLDYPKFVLAFFADYVRLGLWRSRNA
jgi:N-acetylglucosaminyldiphosphoundecaprenol N-acetyl-beta-D-mannosaminyltransferase